MTREEVIAKITKAMEIIQKDMDEGNFGCVDIETWEKYAERLDFWESVLSLIKGEQNENTKN